MIEPLRPDIARIPMSTLECVGGAQGLVRAADHVAARPADTVLVVVAEMLSTVYNHHDTTPQSVIYKTLFADSAAACLVTGSPLGPGLRIDDTWEYVLPASRDRYRGRLDAHGLHFDSETTATQAVNDLMPALQLYLKQQNLEQPDFVVLHPGGPRILHDLETGLNIEQPDPSGGLSRHAWATLQEDGNLGGPAVLAVLARTHQTPPPPDSRGILLGVGPGFSAAACTTTWTSEQDTLR
ncbi:hypothetical protein [Streptomyces sp. NPDC096193]|uniref:hypothetical protein n=1 Tax=Streptomyces sp. NPDC096193 TaxID=3155821 RepID=UPI00331A4298